MTVKIELPPDVEIDRSRIGILSITPEAIGSILNFPRSLQVVGARIEYGYGCEMPVIELKVVGEPMPKHSEGSKIQNVHALFRQEIAGDGSRTIYCNLCGTEWVVSRTGPL